MANPTPAEVAEVLRRAASKITAQTWCRGTGVGPKEGCAVIWLHRQTSYEQHDLYLAARDSVCNMLGIRAGSNSLGDWNDEAGRTADEVRDVLLRAAERVESQS